MARTARTSTTRRRTTSRGGNSRRSSGPKVNFIKDSKERNVGKGQFLRLDTDEKFVGYPLFDPDPALDDNPGYREYEEHWDTQAQRMVPCWGKSNGCIFCKAGVNASTRAMTAFLVTEINGEALDEPEIKLFRMNWQTMQEWIDELDEDGSIIGKKVRIKCLSRDDGDYSTKFYEKDKLTKKDLTAALKDVPDIEQAIQRNLDNALQALRVSAVLDEDDEDDEDEDDEPTTKTNKKPSSRKTKDEDEDEDDEDEDEEDEDEEDEEEDEAEDEDDEDGDDEEDEEDDEDDEDDEEDEEDEDEDEEDDEEDEEDEDEALAGTYTIASVNESESTFTLKELDSDLYFSKEVLDDLDFDDFKKGEKIEIVAEKDADDDWVSTSLKKATAKRGRPASSNKTSSGKKTTTTRRTTRRRK